MLALEQVAIIAAATECFRRAALAFITRKG